MALPTFVAAGTGAGTTGGASPGLPAAQLGDILILVIEGLGDATFDDPPDSTWTPIGPGSIASATDSAADRTRLSCYWAPYSTTINRAVPDAGNHTIARLYAFRGVNLANPINGAGSGSNSTNATGHTAATGITTTVNDCLVAVAYSHGNLGLSSPGSPANASLANVADGGALENASGNDGTLGLIYGEKATAGTAGTFTWTTATSEENAWIAFALNPTVGDATLKHDFEGSTDGVDLNSVTTNTLDNNPVVAEYTPGAATAQFDTAQFAHGAASGQFTVASGENAYVIWNAAAVTERFWRLYLRFDDTTVTNNTTIVRLENAGTFVGDVQIRTTGAIALRDASFTLRYITTTLLSPNTWYRFEFRYVHNTTTGHMEGRLYASIDSTTPTETIGSPSTNWNTGAAVTDFLIGVASNPGQSLTMWVDDFATDPTDWIGPWTAPTQQLEGTGNATSEGVGTLSAVRSIGGAGDASSEGTGTLSTTRSLAGAGDAASEGTGSLELDISLAGAGNATSEGVGTLTTVRTISGTGNASSEGAGTLTITRGLAGAGDASSEGTGSLDATRNLSGAGNASSEGTGSLTLTVRLSGAGNAASEGSGMLVGTVPLAGTGNSTSEGTGTLTLDSALAGAGDASSEGTGTLSATRSLSGAGDAASEGQGDLDAPLLLAGTGNASSEGAGGLTITRGLSGAGNTTSEGAAFLNTTRPLSGAGNSSSEGAGVLSTSVGLAGVGNAASAGFGVLAAVRALSGKGNATSDGRGSMDGTYPVQVVGSVRAPGVVGTVLPSWGVVGTVREGLSVSGMVRP